MKPLPKGWAWAAIKDFCEVNPTKPPADALPADEPVTFVPMPAVSVEGRIESPELRPFGEVRRGSYTPFRDGDVLFAKIAPCMENGKGAVAENLTHGIGFGSTEFHVFRPEGGCSPRYLHLLLRQTTVRTEAARNMTGTAGQMRVPADWIANCQVPLPPVVEQRRIVAKVEELLGHIAHGKAYLDALLKKVKRFRAAVLAAACAGKPVPQDPTDEPASTLLKRILAERRAQWEADLRAKGKDPSKFTYREPAPPDTDGLPELPEGWEWATIDQLSYRVTSGSRGWAKHYASSGSLFVRVGNFGRLDTKVDLQNAVFVNAPSGPEADRTRLRIGDLLITVTADVGMVGVVDSHVLQWGEAYMNQHVALVRPGSTDVVTFVAWGLASEPLQEQIRRKQYGATKSGLDLDDVKSLIIPLPPLPERHRIVAKVKELMSLTDNIAASVQAAQRRAERLTQAVLVKAFRGELVPQDPADEPASALLERIRAERQRRAEEAKAEKAARNGTRKKERTLAKR